MYTNLVDAISFKINMKKEICDLKELLIILSSSEYFTTTDPKMPEWSC